MPEKINGQLIKKVLLDVVDEIDLPPINVPPAKLNLQPQKPLGLVVCTPKSCEAGTGYIPSARVL